MPVILINRLRCQTDCVRESRDCRRAVVKVVRFCGVDRAKRLPDRQGRRRSACGNGWRGGGEGSRFRRGRATAIGQRAMKRRRLVRRCAVSASRSSRIIRQNAHSLCSSKRRSQATSSSCDCGRDEFGGDQLAVQVLDGGAGEAADVFEDQRVLDLRHLCECSARLRAR